MQPSIGISIGLVALVLRVSGALARTGTTITDLGLRAGPSPNTELLLTVIGIEGSVAVACLDSSRRSPFFPTSDTYTADVDLLTTVTGRVGYARDKWLAYAKGGWAGADIELTLVRPWDAGACQLERLGQWLDGRRRRRIFHLQEPFARLEYDYAELNKDGWRISCPTCPSGVGGGVPVVDGDLNVQSVTARLNYRFGG
jgi:opacity protein-like surface antigen